MVTVDGLIAQMGEFGRFQKFLFFFLSLPCASMSIAVYAVIFLEHSPKFTCNLPDFCTLNETDNQCDMFCTIDEGSSVQQECMSFNFSQSIFQNTLITEFKAVCSLAYLKTISSTTYMAGMLFGSLFFGWFSDRFGRLLCFGLTLVFLTFGSITAAFPVNYVTYIGSRFITSMGAMGMFITSFVLLMEYVGPSYRTLCGFGIQIPFACGEMYIGVLAYYIRNWRTLQLIVAGPFFAMFSYLFYLPESIRWLIAKGETAKAKRALAYVAKYNHCAVPENDLVTLSTRSLQKIGTIELLTMSGMRLRLAIICFNWVVTTICYYAISLSTSLFEDNVFLAFISMAAMEIPSYVFCMIVADAWGRKPILTMMQIISGLACIISGCIPLEHKHVILAFTLVGKFGATAAFGIVYVYTAELFPTEARNSAIGFCSTCARVGAILAPLIPDLAQFMPQLPFLVMGIPALIGGILAYKLPETAGKLLPDNIQEALELYNSSLRDDVILSENEYKSADQNLDSDVIKDNDVVAVVTDPPRLVKDSVDVPPGPANLEEHVEKNLKDNEEENRDDDDSESEKSEALLPKNNQPR